MPPVPASSICDVLYEDDWLVAFDKPNGLLVVPDRWDKELANLMRRVHDQLSPEYMNAHRLDRDTSGVLLCAKNTIIGRQLVEQFEQHQVQKTYWAITRGGPHDNSGKISLSLAPDPRRPGAMCVHLEGKESETDFQVLERYKANYQIVEARPKTGRTHQIRVHLAAIGAPIVGDPLYGEGLPLYLSELKRNFKKRGDERPLINRLALLARSLTFTHPHSGKPLTITAPPPRDFDVALENLQKYPASNRG